MTIEKAILDLKLVERALNTAFKTGAPQQLLMELEYRRSLILKWLLEEQLREFNYG